MGGQKGRALRVIEIPRHRRKRRLRDDDLLRQHAPALDDDSIADRNVGDVAGDFDDVTGRLHPRNERQRRLVLIVPCDHQHVGIVQAGRAHGDAHLPCRERL